jgi:glucodextranase-like protein
VSWKPILVGGLFVLSGCAASAAAPPAKRSPRPATDAVTLRVSRVAPTRSSSVLVRGSVTRGGRVTVSGRRAVVHAGRFRARVTLAVGSNRIRIVARKAGYATVRRTVTIRRRSTPPASTPEPTPTATPTSTPTPAASNCDPNYAGACLDPNASDYDCLGGSGDGPKYTGPVRVVGDDHYDLDRDGDGYACE